MPTTVWHLHRPRLRYHRYRARSTCKPTHPTTREPTVSATQLVTSIVMVVHLPCSCVYLSRHQRTLEPSKRCQHRRAHTSNHTSHDRHEIHPPGGRAQEVSQRVGRYTTHKSKCRPACATTRTSLDRDGDISRHFGRHLQRLTQGSPAWCNAAEATVQQQPSTSFEQPLCASASQGCQ